MPQQEQETLTTTINGDPTTGIITLSLTADQTKTLELLLDMFMM
jgi:hypothetical protein